MSHPSAPTLKRLLGALETLASQEGTLLAQGAWSELALLQDREAALVARIGELMQDPALQSSLSPELLTQVDEIGDRQNQTMAELKTRLTACQEELSALGSTQVRVQTIRPAYRSTAYDRATQSFFQQG